MTSDLQKATEQTHQQTPTTDDAPICAVDDKECIKRWLESSSDCV